jgi:hypothetical protein
MDRWRLNLVGGEGVKKFQYVLLRIQIYSTRDTYSGDETSVPIT